MIDNLLCNLFINCAKGTTEHIEILKKLIMTILILRIVLYNPKVLKNNLVKTIIECYDW
jgi:hypothetical protein